MAWWWADKMGWQGEQDKVTQGPHIRVMLHGERYPDDVVERRIGGMGLMGGQSGRGPGRRAFEFFTHGTVFYAPHAYACTAFDFQKVEH